MTHPALDLIRQRTSTNFYDPAFTLDDATIRALVAYAVEAPSSYNLQNWRFIAVTTPAGKQTLMDAAYGQRKVLDSAVTFIVCGLLEPQRDVRAVMQPFHDEGHIDAAELEAWIDDTTRSYEGKPQKQRDEAIRSGSMAAMNLMLAAQAMGLASGPMIGFDPAAVAAEFDLAPIEVPVMLVTVGRAAAGNWPRKRRRPVDHVLAVV